MLFALRPGFDGSRQLDPQVAVPDITVNSELQFSTDVPQRFRCELSVNLHDELNSNFPYIFSVVLVGHFTSPVKMTEEQVNSLIKPNTSSILYSAAREIVSAMTTRANYPGFLLPTLTFVEAQKDSATTEPKQLSGTKKRSLKSQKTSTKKEAAKSTSKSMKLRSTKKS
jgi:preprotein translocase subunit SecB